MVSFGYGSTIREQIIYLQLGKRSMADRGVVFPPAYSAVGMLTANRAPRSPLVSNRISPRWSSMIL